MKKSLIISVWLLIIGKTYSLDLEPTILVLNQFDRQLPKVDSTLIANFSKSIFEFESPVTQLFGELDQVDNPAAWRMELVKELGIKHNVNFILFNRIKHEEKRFFMEGQLYNTRSGGLIHRRKIDLANYVGGQINELNLWVGNVFNHKNREWDDNRESILFKNPEEFEHQNTPMGAAMRSLIVPGWGQAYSDKKTSAKIWAGTESSLSLAILISFLNYDKATTGYLKNIENYNNTDNEKEVAEYKAQAESDWDDHVKFNNLMIAFAGATGTGWIANSIHAWIVGPKPLKNIYQKWDPPSSAESG